MFFRTITGLMVGAVLSAGIATGMAQAATTELTQLNNLTVTAIESNGDQRVLTTESQMPICPPAQPGMATCLAIGMRQYTVVVNSSTKLMNKERGALVGEIVVGDQINAYGALSGDTGSLEARIVRVLTRSTYAKKVQIEDLRVTAITAGKDGLQIDAVRGNGPCWSYSGSSRLAYPCPAGTQPAPYVREDGNKMAMIAQVYAITLPRTATVLDAKRQTISASRIQVGDMINVYGQLIAGGTMRADVLRITSGTTNERLEIRVPSGSAKMKTNRKAEIVLEARGGTAPYTWTAEGLPEGVVLNSEPTIYCFTTPCPQPENAKVTITGKPIKAGEYFAVIQVTDAQGTISALKLPIAVTGKDVVEAVRVEVATDKNSYEIDDTIRVKITATNTTKNTQRITFTNGCQADYDLVPGFSLRAIQLCALALEEVSIAPGKKLTYEFRHDLQSHALPKIGLPFEMTVIGRVQGVGEAQKVIRITAIK